MIKHHKRRRKRENSEDSDSDDDDRSIKVEGEEEAQIRRDAEEIERYIEQERQNLTKLLTEFPDDTKLTRRKARELDHDIIQLLHLGTNAGDVSAEIKDLQDMLEDSDDDDEEYQPNPDEEYHSDDPLSTTCSDIDSQPRTPAEALIHSGLDDSFTPSSQPLVEYDEDGVFKRPVGPGEPKTPGNPDVTIYKRTRSKFCLNTTDIETIEENFKPPDVKDNHDNYLDPDESWQAFLKEFQRPLNSLKTDGDEEEEETDPEYVALPSEAADVEEVEDTPITDEEVKALLNALLDIEEDEEEENLQEDYCDQEPVPETVPPPSIIVQDPDNPLSVQWSHIQPVAVLHTKPELPRSYEMVLGADNKIYILPRAFLRELVPAVPRRNKRKEGPVIDNQMTIDIRGDLSELIEEVYDNKQEYREYATREQVGVFTAANLRRLQIQLMKHSQLLGMCYTQAYSNPLLMECTEPAMIMLTRLMELKKTSVTIQHLCWNLQDVYDMCLEWKKELDVDSEENREYVKWWWEGLQQMRQINRFPKRLRELWLNSKAMVFSEFFPFWAVRNKSISDSRSKMGKGEKLLFVMSLQEMLRLHPTQTMSRCRVEFIQHYAPWRNQLYLPLDVINEFLRTRQVPEVKPETMDFKSYDDVLPPAQRPKDTLPNLWNKYLFSKERIRRVYKDIVQPRPKQTPVKEAPPPAKPKPRQKLEASENKPLVSFDYKDFKIEFHIPEEKEPEEPAPPQREVLSSQQPVNLSVLGNPEITAAEKARLGKLQLDRLKKKRKFDIVRNLIHGIPRRSKSLEQIRRRKCSLANLHEGLWRLNEELQGGLAPLDESWWSTKFFYALKEFDTYARLLFARMKPIMAASPSTSSAKKGSVEDSGSTLGPAAKRSRLDDEAVVAKRTFEMNKQYLRAQRIHDNNRVLLQPEATAIAIERDSLFAWNFSNEVQRALTAEGKASEFDEYLNILIKFNPRTQGVPELYKKLEDLFLPHHPDFLEMFLSFLLPWHAAAVGKYFEHLLVANMKAFVAKLKIYFDKQPNQLKKIHGLLREFATEEITTDANQSVETVKQRFLPLLKGNPLLIDWFNQLMPAEAPPEAQDDEFEELQTKNDLPFEEIPGALITDVPDCPQTCAIKYMQGRIQYGNRVILPADLSFLATSYELNASGGEEQGKEKSRSAEKRLKEEQKGSRKKLGKKRKERMRKLQKSPEKPVGCVHAISPAWDIKVDEGEEHHNNSCHREANVPGGGGGGGGGENNSLNGSVNKEEVPLCDAATLRAHMNRLNPPTVDSSTAGGGVAGISDEVTIKTSPKKNHEWKTVPMYSRTTRSTATKPVSPKKGVASSSSSLGGQGAGAGGGSINAHGPSSPKKNSASIEGGGGKKKRQNSLPPPPLIKEELKAEPRDEPEEIIMEDEEEEVPIVWTREEDKTMLEAITEQQDRTEEEILDQLAEQLAGRNRRDINSRFQFLINVVRQFHGA